jgi:vitamin B12 transporter
MKKKIFIVAAVLFSSRLCSQQPDSVVADIAEFPSTNVELLRVVVTATKFPRKQSETGKVMNVITRYQLEQSSGKTLGEVLNTVPGTTIIGANNNLGTNQTVSIRGASAGNVLILIDGIPVNDPSVITNYFDLNLLSIDQIERIEILKGGQSTLYGSDAVAGVINIIMRKASAKKFSVSGNLSGGSYNTFKESISLNAKQKSVSYFLGYTHLSSKGFSAAYDKNKTGGFDKDGYHQHVVNGRVNAALNKKTQVYFSGAYSFYKSDLDASAYTDEKDYTVKNKNVQVGTGLSCNYWKGSLHFNYHFNYVSRYYIDDSLFRISPFFVYSDTRFIGRTHFAEIYNNWQWDNVELVTGADFRYNNTYQYSLYAFAGSPPQPSILNAKMSQLAPYASVILKNDEGLVIELGSRFNHHSEYGNNLSFTFNPSYRINNKAKVFANLYTAYKVPTLYQLFDSYAGNADLKPENGSVAEVGGELFPNKQFHARLVGFYRHTKNAIVYMLNPLTFESKYINASRQKNYGAELEISYTMNKWSFAANYTYTDGKIISAYDGTGVSIGKDTAYYNLYRIPKNTLNVSISCQATSALFISIHVRAVSKREEFIYGGMPETQKGYATIDLYGEYVFSKKIKAFIDLKNLTNKKYFDIPGYNSRRFNFMTGVSFNL